MTRIWTLMGMLAALAVFSGCKSDEPGSDVTGGGESTAKKAGHDMDEAADEAGDKVEKAADDVGDKVDEATE